MTVSRVLRALRALKVLRILSFEGFRFHGLGSKFRVQVQGVRSS